MNDHPGSGTASPSPQSQRWWRSLDWLSVLLAIALAIAIRMGVKIPW